MHPAPGDRSASPRGSRPHSTRGSRESTEEPREHTTNTSPPTAQEGRSPAEEQLWLLLQQLEQLVPELPEAALAVAATRIATILPSDNLGNGEGSPHLPMARQLAYGAVEHDGERSEAGSMASIADGSPAADDCEAADDSSADGGDDATADDGGGRDPPADYSWDERMWPGGPLVWQPLFEHLVTRPADGADGDADEAGGAADDEHAGGVRDTRLGRWHGRDSIGLAEGGRVMYCDYCDLNGGDRLACMAVDMLEQRRIGRLIEKHEKQLRRQSRASDLCQLRRDARHACYKEVVAWQWSNPLGAESRVRLPSCVERCVRRRFPNPICSDGCDYSDACIASGHYTGFRTAAKSRAIREGRFLGT